MYVHCATESTQCTKCKVTKKKQNTQKKHTHRSAAPLGMPPHRRLPHPAHPPVQKRRPNAVQMLKSDFQKTSTARMTALQQPVYHSQKRLTPYQRPTNAHITPTKAPFFNTFYVKVTRGRAMGARGQSASSTAPFICTLMPCSMAGATRRRISAGENLASPCMGVGRSMV